MDRASDAIAALCEFQVINSDGRATLFGERIRYDEATGLISVKDAIMIIEGEGITSAAAIKRIKCYKDEKYIVVSEDAATGYANFKDENNQKIIGVRLRDLPRLCFYLRGTKAQRVTECMYEIGIRYLIGDRGLYNNFEPSDNFCPELNLCLSRKRKRAGAKERKVFDFLTKAFEDDVWVFNKNYGSYRPDALLQMTTHAVIVEIDENQHKNYNPVEEIVRVRHLSQNIDKPVVFIRFNPDGYAVGKRKRKFDLRWEMNASGDFVASDDDEWNARLRKLKETVSYHKTNVPSRHRCVKLFYDRR